MLDTECFGRLAPLPCAPEFAFEEVQSGGRNAPNALMVPFRLEMRIQDRKRLAYLRFEGGVEDRDLFQAQLSLSEIRLNELLSVVQLYKVLGGGWQ